VTKDTELQGYFRFFKKLSFITTESERIKLFKQRILFSIIARSSYKL